MKKTRCLTVLFCVLAVLAPGAYAGPGAPEISAVSIVADDVLLVYGSGFDAKSVDFRFDFADWPTSRVAHASGDKAGAAAAAQ
ncbi:MAG: hypothetical protein Q8O57_11460, partial [Kiritimatiellota bacterium]|nr:hypothetical protein [Kiritimatiellota bacterium]